MAIRHELSSASLVKLISFLFWCGLYIYSSVSWPDKCPEWHSRLITFLHGTVATVVGLSQCGIRNLTPYRLNMKITSSHYALMAWSWGYFACDLLWCILHSEPWLMLCHHVSAIIAISIYMHKEYTGCTFACNLAMMEMTNPLLQTRWFLRYEGYHSIFPILYLLVEVMYLLSFLMVRGVLGSYLFYKIMYSDMFDLDEKLISLALYFISVGLIYQIVGYIVHRFKNKVTIFLNDVGIIINDPYYYH